MKTLSNGNYSQALRLLKALAGYPGLRARAQDEARRKAGLLVKRLNRMDEREKLKNSTVKSG